MSSIISAPAEAETSARAAKAQMDAAEDAMAMQWQMYETSREDLMPWRDMGAWALGGPEGFYVNGKFLGSDLSTIDEKRLKEEAENNILPLFGGELPSKSSNRKLYNQMVEEEISNLRSGLQKQPGTGLAGMIAKGPGEFEKSPGYEFVRQEGEKAIRRGTAATGRSDSGATMKALTRYNQNYASTEYDKFLARYYDTLKPYQSLAGLGQTTAGQMSQTSYQTGLGIAETELAKGTAKSTGYINTGQAASGALQEAGNLAMMWAGGFGDTYFGMEHQKPTLVFDV